MNKAEIDYLMPTPSKHILQDINRNLNNFDAELRIAQWIDLLSNPKYQNLSEYEKLKLVNNFFNKIPYQTDDLTWRRADYWATPIQILSKNVADCEDYAIAKYLTLRKLGVIDAKLRLTIVKSSRLKGTHMVLTYRDQLADTPLVLDSNIKEIKKTADTYYLPIYSFNNQKVWRVDQTSSIWDESEEVENHSDKWNDLKQRLKIIH